MDIQKTLNKRRLVCSSLLSFIIAFLLVTGEQIDSTSNLNTVFFSFNMILVTSILTFLFYKLFGLKTKKRKPEKIKIKRWQLFLLLFIPSMFLLFACFPGTYSWDDGTMYHRYATGQHTTHFSILISWFLGICIDFGTKILGNSNIGLAIFITAQAAVATFAIASILLYISNKLKSQKFLVIFILYFILHPLIQNRLIAAHQDTFFGAFFLLLLLEVVKMINEEEYFSKKKNWLLVSIFVFLMCACRNNGFFALLPALCLGLLFFKGKRKQYACILAIPLILFQFYNNFVVSKIVVKRESLFQESLSVPIMQIARSIYKNDDLAKNEDLKKFFKKDCNWQLYDTSQDLSDDFKNCLNTGYVSDHFTEFLKFWAEMGVKNPQSFIEAPLVASIRMYYPWINYDNDKKAHNYHSYEYTYVSGVSRANKDDINIESSPKIPAIFKFMQSLTSEQKWSKIYGFRLIWCGAFTTLSLIIAVFMCLYKKRYKMLIPLSFIFGILLTVFLGPTIYFRYMFPAVISTPVIIYAIFSTFQSRGEAPKLRPSKAHFDALNQSSDPLKISPCDK